MYYIIKFFADLPRGPRDPQGLPPFDVLARSLPEKTKAKKEGYYIIDG
jgi:hypothetical protein